MVDLTVVLALSLAVIASFFSCCHKIHEGHIGVYWRNGALLEKTTDPGVHLKLPLLTTVDSLQIIMQTDKVTNIPCGTRGGVMVYFEKVEVVNRLRREYVYDTVKNYTVNYDSLWIFDRVHHEINQLCSSRSLQQIYIDEFHLLDELIIQSLQEQIANNAPGIEIISVRVTKPRVPDSLVRNYEQMEMERTKLLIAEQRRRVMEKEQETAKMIATISAQKDADVSNITLAKKMNEKRTAQDIQVLEDKIHSAKQQALADAQFYTASKQAEVNKLKLSPAFLKLEAANAIAGAHKTYYGSQLPTLDLVKDL